MTPSLYPIQKEHLDILALIAEADGEVTPEIELRLSFTQERMQEVGISMGYAIKQVDNDLSIIDTEIARLTAMKKKGEKVHSMFKDRLSAAMQQFGIQKIASPTLTLSFRKSTAVIIEDEALLPSDLIITKTTTQADKNSIKKRLEEGESIPGASLETRQNLQIK